MARRCQFFGQESRVEHFFTQKTNKKVLGLKVDVVFPQLKPLEERQLISS